MRFSTIAMKHVILAGVAIIEIVTASAFLFAFYYYANRAAEEHASSSIRWALASVEQELSLFVDKVETVTDLTLGLSQSEILDLSDSDKVERYFFDALTASPRFTGLYYAGVDGSFIFATREAPDLSEGEVFVRRVAVENGEKSQSLYVRSPEFRIARRLPDQDTIFDASSRPWYKSAMAYPGVQWTDPYIFYTSKRPGITVSNQVRSPTTGEITGVIGLDLSFRRLSEFVRRLEISPNGKAFIADRGGRLIAFPHDVADLDGAPNALPGIDSETAPVAAESFRQAHSTTDLPLITAIDIDGTRYVAAINVLKLNRGEWVVGAYAPKSDFLNWFEDVTVATFWLTLLLTAVGMAGGIALWRTVQKRLSRIQIGADALVNGTCQPFEYEPTGFVELQTTEKALSDMAQAIIDRENALTALNGKLAEVMRAVDKMPIGVGVFTPHQSIRYVNAVAAAILSLTGDGVETFDDALIDRLDAACLPDRGSAPLTLREALSRQERWEGEFLDKDLLGRDKGIVYRMIVVPLSPIGSGKFVLAVEDVTQQKSLERHLVTALETATEASQAKSMFLANMSHELRTPLNSILGFSDTIRHEIHGPVGDPHYAEYINHIFESGKSLLDILSNLLDLTAIESGRMTLKADAEDFSRIIEEALSPHRTACRAAGLTVTLNLPDSSPIQADATKLRQAVGNLIQNAARYATDASQLTVTLRDLPNGRVELTVEDDGVGIPEERFDRVLQPFRRSVENSHVAATDGVGLGLPIAKAIFELHGGTLKLSRGLSGKGLRIIATIPRGGVPQNKTS
ncbi:hypothetical protein HH303_07740 [Rhodospirillaceae bacterium KN72]|uniref:histidine kinase n=1 Tax=Pacificispira spongiicola TaxID=2729598 RepID=A0A7Y0DZD8_9PROT|nr:sensor histidine kinase [Pacificispira spongiicola]NMM44366.1 hypothetical protein [Pacificispira spongiicola]